MAAPSHPEGRCGGTREEHLAFAKSRALQILDSGDVAGAHASMASDLTKHEAWQGPAFVFIFAAGMLDINRGAEAIRHWIEGFN
jgi:hypothetical protein